MNLTPIDFFSEEYPKNSTLNRFLFLDMTHWKAGKNAGEVIPFVEGWDFVGILGEGAFGEVRLVANSAHNIAAAAKIVNLDELNEETKTSIEREIKVHRLLKHKNIIRYYSHRFHQPWNSHLIFMEYASGGELFDKLKPDVGMSESQAQYYFRQLLDGVNFMHRKVGGSFQSFYPKILKFNSFLGNLSQRYKARKSSYN